MNFQVFKETIINSISLNHLGLDAKLVLSITGAFISFLSGLTEVIIKAEYQFVAVTATVLFTWLTGMYTAYKQDRFNFDEAAKVLLYMVLYNGFLFLLLLIERGYEFASFLSEAIVLPILVNEIIKILTHFNALGLITSEKLKQIINKVDPYHNKQKSEVHE